MSILCWFLIIIVIILVVPILTFLIAKWATVGFYKGKEAYKGQVKRSIQKFYTHNDDNYKS